jgi:hypothetical protein
VGVGAHGQHLGDDAREQLLVLADREDDLGRDVEGDRDGAEGRVPAGREPLDDLGPLELEQVRQAVEDPLGLLVAGVTVAVEQQLPFGADGQRGPVLDQLLAVGGEDPPRGASVTTVRSRLVSASST